MSITEFRIRALAPNFNQKTIVPIFEGICELQRLEQLEMQIGKLKEVPNKEFIL
jgi:hypothetical protein